VSLTLAVQVKLLPSDEESVQLTLVVVARLPTARENVSLVLARNGAWPG
jgi:hypothetical protein